MESWSPHRTARSRLGEAHARTDTRVTLVFKEPRSTQQGRRERRAEQPVTPNRRGLAVCVGRGMIGAADPLSTFWPEFADRGRAQAANPGEVATWALSVGAARAPSRAMFP